MTEEYKEKFLEGYQWYNTSPLRREYQYCPYEWGTEASIAWYTGLCCAKMEHHHPETD